MEPQDAGYLKFVLVLIGHSYHLMLIGRIPSLMLINSRTAIAEAIIGLLLVFLQFKEFELYWGAVFFFF